jgi:hypothetical protein
MDGSDGHKWTAAKSSHHGPATFAELDNFFVWPIEGRYDSFEVGTGDKNGWFGGM